MIQRGETIEVTDEENPNDEEEEASGPGGPLLRKNIWMQNKPDNLRLMDQMELSSDSSFFEVEMQGGGGANKAGSQSMMNSETASYGTMMDTRGGTTTQLTNELNDSTSEH